MSETPAEMLRRAAKLMRQHAELVPPPPWYSAVHDVTTHDGLDVIASSGLTVRAEYVASWHPGVALALADLLDEEAERAAGMAGYEDSNAYPLMLAGFRLPLAIARAYLGEVAL